MQVCDFLPRLFDRFMILLPSLIPYRPSPSFSPFGFACPRSTGTRLDWIPVPHQRIISGGRVCQRKWTLLQRRGIHCPARSVGPCRQGCHEEASVREDAFSVQLSLSCYVGILIPDAFAPPCCSSRCGAEILFYPTLTYSPPAPSHHHHHRSQVHVATPWSAFVR